MPIQILPAQLANQIAAGEVVERPASVVKELVENCLDAGATRIDIDIERGGEKRIRIRDNGCGIRKADLTLALARHATSKISSLDDLEAILSLGFRGEALASISAVSRLTLSSRTASQEEAWQTYAEGRDMEAVLKPTAHPIGTTVEVLDLFYNTPARRKFLRTEKTEFGHIDEVLRRIALARFDVTFNVNHNGKMVRQYRGVKQDGQRERRLAAICGAGFLQHALALNWQHGDLAIDGWVANPHSDQLTNDVQYCYVNGRMIRDKLITHAIRQAYQEQLNDNQQPAYILYLTIDPHQVDVNVHPAKHEVRFHQARLVHDFIFQAVVAVLQQEGNDIAQTYQVADNRGAAGINQFNAPACEASPAYRHPSSSPVAGKSPITRPTAFQSSVYQKKEGECYQRLIQTPSSSLPERMFPHLNASTAPNNNLASQKEQENRHQQPISEAPLLHQDGQSFGRLVMVYRGHFALLARSDEIVMVNLLTMTIMLQQKQLLPDEEKLKAQPLLIPVKLTLSKQERQTALAQSERLQHLGIDLHFDGNKALLRAVPMPLRQQNLPQLIPDFLVYLSQMPDASSRQVATWLAQRGVDKSQHWNMAQAIQLIAEVERLSPQLIASPPQNLLQRLDLSQVLRLLQMADPLDGEKPNV